MRLVHIEYISDILLLVGKCFVFSAGYAMVIVMAPRIIPRKEHRISRKQISPNALRTLYRLHNHGFISYLVGGCVRDLFLARTPKDFDIATNATPGQIKRLFHNCRLVGRRFRLAHLFFQDEILEVSTFRRAADPLKNEGSEDIGRTGHATHHVIDKDGMVLRDNIFGTPEEDALRRDFTINALAYNIADFSVIDFSTGLSDLEEHIIRPIGDPYVRFTEDPARMLRAVRFAASHNFVIEPAAWETLCSLSNTITRASPARLYEEIQKLFLFGSARPAFNLLDKSGLLSALFPGLTWWIYEDIRRPSILETYLENLDRLCLDGIRPSPALFMASLFGPVLEEIALVHTRTGIPYQQALNVACNDFLKDIRNTVSFPGKIVNRLHDILSLQSPLRKSPPRRPLFLAGKQEFNDALSYFRFTAQVKKNSMRV